MRLLPALIQYVKMTSFRRNIDESHGLGHSFNVLHHAHEIFTHSVDKYPFLKEQEPIIYTSCILHDMCDKKYMNATHGVKDINTFLQIRMNPTDIATVENIVNTMSYSYVKKFGYPELGKYQMAYHVVREADLLSAYDVNRAIIYEIYNNLTVDASIQDSYNLFDNRVLKYKDDNLFITDYSKEKSAEMEKDAMKQIEAWKKIKHCFEIFDKFNESL